VDPICHLTFGSTLYCLDRESATTRGALAAFLLGSVLPDVDTALIPVGMDVYLLHHQAGTHSLLATPVEAAFLATLLRVTLPADRWLSLFLASWLAVLGHLFWDLADGSDIRLLAPFSQIRFGWHLMGMGDPLVLVPLLAAVIVYLRFPAMRRRAALSTLALLGLLLAGKAASQAAAARLYADALRARGEALSRSRREEIWGSFFRWRFLDRRGDRLRAWVVDVRRSEARLVFERTAAAEGASVAASRSLPVVRNFLGQAEMPFAWQEQEGGRELVMWSDLGLCGPSRCAMAFGGVFDERAKPLSQWVQIGPHRFERPLPEAVE
jgi:membrane-bound metal-dependent hydrolase YbcI (DUF457 family)